jgi:CRISPR-associated protein Csm1
LWKRVIDKAAAGKYTKFKKLISEDFNTFFEPDGNWEKGEKFQLCAVTGEEGIKNQTLVNLNPRAEAEEEKVWVLKSVKEQAELGNSLKDADYILTYLGKDHQKNSFLEKRAAYNIGVANSGIFHYLFDEEQLSFDDAEFRKISSVDVARVRGINLPEFYHYARLKGTGSSYGYLFYGGNKQAKAGKENKTFEQLCMMDSKNSETYLGILRMDVDGLGQIFADGIPIEKRSFAAYSTLSAQLDWFFSGYLNTIRNSESFKDHVNIIYSGGDDVFAVGRWDKIIVFAENIRSEFRRFTGREDISISGGIAIVNAKFPIRLAASMAGDAEGKAKLFNNEQKNALCIFGEVIGWENEWPEVKTLKEELVRLMTIDGGLSKAFLHQIIRWKVQKDEGINISFRWHTAYYLKRYSKKYEKNPLIVGFLEKMRNALFTGHSQFSSNKQKHNSLRYYDLAAVAGRWAEMEIKEVY